MFDSPQKLQKTVTGRALLLAASSALLTGIGGNYQWAGGLILGGLCSVAHFCFICITAARLVESTAAQARFRAFLAYCFRYLITAGVLAYSFFEPTVSFPATVFGLLTVKVVILMEALRQRWVMMLQDQLQRTRCKLERREFEWKEH